MSDVNFHPSWLNLTIDDVADVVAGGTPKAGDPNNFEAPGKGIAWLTPADLSGYKNKYINHGARDLSVTGYSSSSAKKMPAGSLLFSSRAPIGYVAIASNEISTNQGFKNFVFPFGVDSSFAYYFLKSIRDLAESLGTGTTFKEISGSTAKTLPFPLPPLAEQKVIADKLDTLLAQVDNTKARLDRIPEILKTFRQSVLAAAVSGKLTIDFLCDSELEDDITEDWIAYHKKIFETIGKQPKSNIWMKSVPKPENRCEFADRLPAGKGWRIFFLDDIIFSKNQGVNTTTEKVEYTSSGIIAIQAGNIQEGYIHFQTDKFVSTEKFESLSAHVKPNSNDVLYTNIGANFGNAAVVPSDVDSFLITWNVMRIVPSRLIMPKYLEMVLNSKIIRDEALKAVSTSTVPFVNGKTIGQYVIPTPQLPEQVEIVRRVEELFAYADRIEQSAQAAQSRVNNLTQSILAKAFRGELTADWRAANLDLISGDNSAEALLAKIKAERAKLSKKAKAKA